MKTFFCWNATTEHVGVTVEFYFAIVIAFSKSD